MIHCQWSIDRLGFYSQFLKVCFHGLFDLRPIGCPDFLRLDPKKKKNSLSFVIRFFRVSWYFFLFFSFFFFFSSSLYSFKTTQSVVYSHDNHTQRKTKNTVKLLEETQEKCTMIQICRQDETKRIKVKFKHMISFEFPANWMCSLKNCNYSWLLLDEFIIIYI